MSNESATTDLVSETRPSPTAGATSLFSTMGTILFSDCQHTRNLPVMKEPKVRFYTRILRANVIT